MGVCKCSMFCCTLLYVHSNIAIIFKGKRELVALLNLSSWCLVMVERLFLAVLWCCLWFVIVVSPDHSYLLFLVSFLECYIKVGYNLDVMRQSAWHLTQSGFIAMVSSLNSRRWVRPQTL